MTSVKDWARAAAEYIVKQEKHPMRIERIAAIVDAFTAPMTQMLRESRREHEQEVYSDCPAEHGGKCDCGADEWNARIDKLFEYGELLDASTHMESKFFVVPQNDPWNIPKDTQEPNDKLIPGLRKAGEVTVNGTWDSADSILEMAKQRFKEGDTVSLTLGLEPDIEVELRVVKVTRK